MNQTCLCSAENTHTHTHGCTHTVRYSHVKPLELLMLIVELSTHLHTLTYTHMYKHTIYCMSATAEWANLEY